MGKIRVYNENEIEYLRLKMFTEICNDLLIEKGNIDDFISVQETYFDYGQNWKYTALIMHKLVNGMGMTMTTYQLFCPRDWELIINTDSIEKIKAMAEYYISLYVSKEWDYKHSLYSEFE